jgi:hypothetical protein
MKRAGWDCMRHYEIVANGCLPYFIDLESCPLFTMYIFPKHLLIRSNLLYERMKKDPTDNKEYIPLLSEMMSYFKEYLTTKTVSYSVLQRTGFTSVKRILYLSSCTRPDYLRCLTLHGFKQLFGTNCHDYPKIPHIYNDYKGDPLYGKGFTYSHLLDPSLRDDSRDSTIIEDIKKNNYDIVVYGSYHRGIPYYETVCQYYPMNKIILLCGEDLHCCNSSIFIKKGHPVFVREL